MRKDEEEEEERQLGLQDMMLTVHQTTDSSEVDLCTKRIMFTSLL